MSLQRRRGQPVVIFTTIQTTDNRGNAVSSADEDNPITDIKAAFIPQRSARAEVPGQAQINVTRMVVKAHIPGMDLWSRVEWDGAVWDVVSPPAYHHGTRHTRHWSIDLRERP